MLTSADLDRGLFTGVVVIALRKAVDVVDYKLLHKKIQVYGFTARTLTPSNGSKVISAGRYQKV